jgi:hypothetical protein
MFFNAFKTGTLGKKRSIGSYRVLDGDHCQVLVRSLIKNGLPGGSELIGITFGHGVTLFHGPNYSNLKSSVKDAVQGQVLRISSAVMDDKADNLLDSGIIDIDEANNKMLIEIGDTPWLFEYEESMVNDQWVWKYNQANKLSVRCTSVAEAVVGAALPPNTISGLGWALERQPAGFEPDGVLPEDRKVMAAPPNPMDYGFKVEDCSREASYHRGVVSHDMLYLKLGMPTSPERDRLELACVAWDEALQRFNDMRPSRWNNISLREGTILCVGGTDGTVYLRGRFCAIYSQTGAITLDHWHKVTGESNVMKLSWR